MDLGAEIVLALIGAAMAAGFVDAIAGGGGLITIPALMLAGVPPAGALATNKVQAVFGAATAAIAYARAGHVDLRRQAGAAVLAFAAGLIGSLAISALPTGWLRPVLPVLLIAIAAYFALKRGLTDADRRRRLSPAGFTALVVPVVGLYDGLLGAGAGSFYMLGFVTLAGYGVLKATAHTKLLNFASNLGSLAGFALAGQPLWLIGLAMAAGQVLGASLGARLAMRGGARVIKPLLVVTCTLMAMRLLWDAF
ncbi:TSUP family transporter [Paracoccus sp. S-4012]|uniref:TSUP family transporter n=1 Tax=Paracoccus sp. S-4012 TaxID=2665648 RepID=UPI0012B0A777|nr:TSUP family transporter [Paracoccus sp. S-4012]MRX49514.1 TSUP family transporter [Paracoccus sp. S-4012]